jgi:hypothetical protein
MAQRELLTATLVLALLGTGTTAIASSEAEANYRKRFPAQWLEREGAIRLDTICYNYPDSSYMYRLCRQQAAQTLKSRCSRYQALLNTYSGDTGAHYRRMADKYCTASEQYQPEVDGKK